MENSIRKFYSHGKSSTVSKCGSRGFHKKMSRFNLPISGISDVVKVNYPEQTINKPEKFIKKKKRTHKRRKTADIFGRK